MDHYTAHMTTGVDGYSCTMSVSKQRKSGGPWKATFTMTRHIPYEYSPNESPAQVLARFVEYCAEDQGWRT